MNPLRSFGPLMNFHCRIEQATTAISVKNMNSIVNKMNNTNSSMIGMKPKVVIKLNVVKHDKTEKHLQKKTHYMKMVPTDRYLYQPSEQHGDPKRWATDFIWSKNTQTRLIIEEPGNHILYYLQCGPDRAFVSEELMHIPEDTHVTPEWVMQMEVITYNFCNPFGL